MNQTQGTFGRGKNSNPESLEWTGLIRLKWSGPVSPESTQLVSRDSCKLSKYFFRLTLGPTRDNDNCLWQGEGRGRGRGLGSSKTNVPSDVEGPNVQQVPLFQRKEV